MRFEWRKGGSHCSTGSVAAIHEASQKLEAV